MDLYRIRRTAKNVRPRFQTASPKDRRTKPSRSDRGLCGGYSPTHDTAQTHAHWAGNPAASSALADSCAAHACDARAERRFNAPDDRPPWSCDWHTGHAVRSAPSEDRHPQGPTRCATPQPDSPHPEQRTQCASVEGRGRAHSCQPQAGATPGPPSSPERGRRKAHRSLVSKDQVGDRPHSSH